MDDLISRQAVIEAINKIFPADPMRDDYTQGITCGAALANIYVAQLPSAQPEPCEDTISRQAAIDAHYEYCNKHPDAGFPVWSLKILEDLPSSQQDLSGYSDRLWKAAYERGKAEAQSEVIRCKECKYNSNTCGNYVNCDIIPQMFGRTVDNFCSRAERRTDEE